MNEYVQFSSLKEGQILVMVCDQTFCELIMNVISCVIIYVNRELNAWQFSLFFVILREKLEQFDVISRKITKTTEIGGGWDFTIYNWSETLFSEMLKIAFEREFSVNVNSPTHN